MRTIHGVFFVAVMLTASMAFAAADADFEKIRTSNPVPDRLVKFTELAAKGPQMKVVAATPYGTTGYEEFVAAAEIEQNIVALGNAWGPEFPKQPTPKVLGKGKWQGDAAATGKTTTPDEKNPNIAGIIVSYNSDLSKIVNVVRFDWSVATISAGISSKKGDAIFLTGRCGSKFGTLPGVNFRVYGTPATFDPNADNDFTGKSYVMRYNPVLQVIDWVYVIYNSKRDPYALWLDDTGSVYFDSGSLLKINAAGDTITSIVEKTASGTAKWLGIDPKDGSSFFGGDRNTHTHKEPWRQPYLYKYNPEGKKLWTLWEAAPADVGSDTNGLESDSSVRTLAINSKHELIVSGWSDGGNSVFPRQAKDFKHYAPEGGFGMVPWWPKAATSFAHLMRLDATTLDTLSHQWWLTYVPTNFPKERNRNAPNSAWIDETKILQNDDVAIAGRAATLLIQTPNAFWKDPLDGNKYGGTCATVFTADMKEIRFSSYLPGVSNPHIAAVKDGVVIVGRTVADDADEKRPTPTPQVNALQGFAGGTDGSIILLRNK